MSEPAPPHRTIKALVLDYVGQRRGEINYAELTARVLEQFPQSRWKRTHWAWYRYQILHGRFRDHFPDETRANLAKGCPAEPIPAAALRHLPAQPSAVAVSRRGRQARDPEVKRLGDTILRDTRDAIRREAGADSDRRFKLNRWVFARLHQEEIAAKRRAKRKLWESGMRACKACGERFASLKGVELHRKNAELGYSVENCELLCRDCHRELAD